MKSADEIQNKIKELRAQMDRIEKIWTPGYKNSLQAMSGQIYALEWVLSNI